MGASRFPMTPGNDFAGVVSAVGSGRASGFAIGERVYGVKPPSRDGTHASHVLVKAAHASKAPANRELQEVAALPYCFVTMWLAAARAGVTRQNAEGKENGAGGGLGTVALQTLSEWGARVTAIAKASDLPACLEAGAAKAVEHERNPFANLRGGFDATLNFATWDAWVLFRPEREALPEIARLVELGRLYLPIGIRAPLRDAPKAFDHLRSHAPGRALLVP